MRVVLTQNLSNYGGRFAELYIVPKAEVVHSKKYSTMNRFESITDIWKRPRYNYTHRVVEVAFFHFAFNGLGCYQAKLCLDCLTLAASVSAANWRAERVHLVLWWCSWYFFWVWHLFVHLIRPSSLRY